MPKHIQRAARDTGANLLGLGSYKADHLYLDETAGSYRLGVDGSTLSAPFMTGFAMSGDTGSMPVAQSGTYNVNGSGILKVAASASGLAVSLDGSGATAGQAIKWNGSAYVPAAVLGSGDVNSTGTIALSVNGSQQLEAAAQVSADAGNQLSAKTDGLYAKGYSVHADSANFIEINSSNEIVFKERAQIKTFAATEATLAAYIAANYTTGTEIQEGDILFIPTTGVTYVHNGGSAGDSSDFSSIDSPSVATADIRNKLSNSDGIDYNTSTGVIAVDLATEDNDAVFAAGKLRVDVSAGAVTDTNSYGATTVQGLFDAVVVKLDRAALRDSNETIQGNWTYTGAQEFDGNVNFDGAVAIRTGASLVIGNGASATSAVNFEFTTASTGMILKSANGTRFAVTVDNDGALTTTAL